MTAPILLLAVVSAETEATRGIELHREGRYQEAAVHFLRAFDLSRNPTQLRNAAKSLEQAEFQAEALALWEQYVELDLPEEKRAEASQRIEALRGLLDERRARHKKAPSIEPSRVDPTPLTSETHAIARWTVAGIGAAAVLGGGGLYLSGWATYWRYESSKDEIPEVTRSDASRARLRSGFGLGLGVTGIVTIVLAFILLRDDPQVAVVPTWNGAMVAIDWD